jgi:hypothetical protein
MSHPTPREHFLPIRKTDLLDLLCRRPGVTEADSRDLRQVGRLIEATLHYEYHALLEALKDCYAPFDPDADAPPISPPPEEELSARAEELFERFQHLLERANFTRLTRAHILEALDAMSDLGMRVDIDFDVFDRLEVFARGDSATVQCRRRWQDRFRAREVEVPIYQRLVVIFRLRSHKRLGRDVDTRTIYLKVFKDIPRQDLEMLLPGSRVRMSYIDQAKVWVPTISGLSMTGWKAMQGAMTVAAVGMAGMAAFLGVVAGLLGLGARSLFGYLRTKEKHQLTLTQSLYYRNLDNNAGVLFRLLDEAEEQEFREAILAWCFLWREAGDDGWTNAELDAAVERFVAGALGREIDFEVHDALGKLARLRIVEQTAEGRFRAVEPKAALAALDRAWDGIFEHDVRAPCGDAHAA